MEKVIAFVLLAMTLFATFLFGLFGIMGARNNFQLLAITLTPTGIVPVAYFLVVHGIFAHDAQHANKGISAAIAIFTASVAILFMGGKIIVMLIGLGVPDQASWPGYVLLTGCVLAQLVLFFYFRKWLNVHPEETKTVG